MIVAVSATSSTRPNATCGPKVTWIVGGSIFAMGFGLFPGTITKFHNAGLKTPHMGWNTLDTRPCVLFDGGQSPFVYFVHSYCMADVSPEWTTATCTYGQTFTAAIQRGNVMATQFHPEKSGEVGLNMLRRFAQWKGDKSC